MADGAIDVFVIYPYLPGGTPDGLYSAADIAWLFDPNHKFSLNRYWREVSGGVIAMVPTLHPPVEALVTDKELALLRDMTDRFIGVTMAVEILSRNGRAAGPSRRVAIFIGGYTIGAGAASLIINNQVWNFAFLDMFGDHEFIAHELGHAFGLDHPFDLSRPGPLPNQEYADPADIMSAALYGTGKPKPRAAVPPADRGPFGAGTATWDIWGPGVSMATLWRYGEHFELVPPWGVGIAWNAAPQAVRLHRAGRRSGQERLIAVAPADHQASSWYMVEYRNRSRWDANIYAWRPEADSFVRILRTRDLGVGSALPGYPKYDQVCYEGIIPLPGGNLDWTDGWLAIRVLSYQDDLVDLLIGYGMPDGPPSARILIESEPQPGSTRPGKSVLVSKTGPQCREKTYTEVIEQHDEIVTATCETTGFTAPKFRYTVNGKLIDVWLGNGEAEVRFVGVAALVDVPTGIGASVPQIRNFTLQIIAEWNSIDITVRAGLGSVEIKVEVEVAETPGSPPTTAASAAIRVNTYRILLPAEAIRDQTQCIVATIPRSVDRGTWIVPMEDPGWMKVVDLRALWESGDRQTLGRALLITALAERELPQAGRRLMARAAKALDVAPQALRAAAERFPPPPRETLVPEESGARPRADG